MFSLKTLVSKYETISLLTLFEKEIGFLQRLGFNYEMAGIELASMLIGLINSIAKTH